VGTGAIPSAPPIPPGGRGAGSRGEIRRDASLAYPDPEAGRSSGWSGSEASKERAHREDANGTTEDRQQRILGQVGHWGQQGRTVKELRDRYPDMHHGQISSALTGLHKAGKILRLAEKRDRCSVYVHPSFLLGREVVPPGRNRRQKVDPAMTEAREAVRRFLAARPPYGVQNEVILQRWDDLGNGVALRVSDLRTLIGDE
jgi:hypothetical protein